MTPTTGTDGLVERLTVMAENIRLNIQYVGVEKVQAEIATARNRIQSDAKRIAERDEMLREVLPLLELPLASEKLALASGAHRNPVEKLKQRIEAALGAKP